MRPSSITSGAAGVAERLAREVGAHRVARVGERLGDDARPCPRRGRRSSPRRAARASSRNASAASSSSAPNARVARGRHAGVGQHLLHPRLRALEPRAGGAGTEREAAARAHRVGDAGDERHLGPDDDEVDVEVVGELRDRGGIGGSTGKHSAVCGDARVAGRGEHLGRPPATAASAHTSACSRPPDPTTRTRTFRRLGAARRSASRSGPTDDEADRARRRAPRRSAGSRAPRPGGRRPRAHVSMSHCHPGSVS